MRMPIKRERNLGSALNESHAHRKWGPIQIVLPLVAALVTAMASLGQAAALAPVGPDVSHYQVS